MSDFKEKRDKVKEIVFGLSLSYTDEDKENIEKLIDAYFRLRKHYTNSKTEFIAGGLLWVYSTINYLAQNDKEWSQKGLADKMGIKPKSISRTSSHIMSSLKIDYFDKRFARKEVIEQDFRNDYFMTSDGFILHKDDIAQILLEQMKRKFGDIIEIDDETELIDLDKKDSKNKSLYDYTNE
ncbi:MAG: DUF6398 domain-containing protein [Candidatus Woesearchaeota archaeon]